MKKITSIIIIGILTISGLGVVGFPQKNQFTSLVVDEYDMLIISPENFQMPFNH